MIYIILGGSMLLFIFAFFVSMAMENDLELALYVAIGTVIVIGFIVVGIWLITYGLDKF